MPNQRLADIALALVLSALSFTALADAGNPDEMTPADWLEADKDFKQWCQQDLEPDAIVFPDSLSEAREIRKDFCERKIETPRELNNRIAEMLLDLQRLFPQSGVVQRIYFAEVAQSGKSGELSQFALLDEGTLAIHLDSIGYERIQDAELARCNSAASSLNSAASCKIALREFRDIYNFAQATLAQPIAFALSQRLTRLEQHWNDYYDESKSQTLWEMSLNKRIFQNATEGFGYAEPPEWQLVVMHPSMVIENVSDAVDGQQTKESIMIEALGADWWQQDKWYLPSGGSLVATYSDRAGVDDWGYGVSLNFDSKFTLGVADHGGELGTFVTVDLLKLLQDKSETIKSYRESVEL